MATIMSKETYEGIMQRYKCVAAYNYKHWGLSNPLEEIPDYGFPVKFRRIKFIAKIFLKILVFGAAVGYIIY